MNIYNINGMPSYKEADTSEEALIMRCHILEDAYDHADSMWRAARNHEAGCECEKCVLEFARSVWNHLQNRKAWNGKTGGKWGVGEDTATFLCARLMDDKEAKNFQPIGDFHGMSIHASTVHPSIAIPTCIHDIEQCFMREHDAHAVPSGHISPRACFMIQAKKYWMKNPFTSSWDDMKSSVATALMLLMVSWARGLAGEGMTYKALDTIAHRHGGHAEWATDEMEHDDIDIIIICASGEKKYVSVKTGRSLGMKTISYYRHTLHKTKPHAYAGGDGIITTENIKIIPASRFDR